MKRTPCGYPGAAEITGRFGPPVQRPLIAVHQDAAGIVVADRDPACRRAEGDPVRKVQPVLEQHLVLPDLRPCSSDQAVAGHLMGEVVADEDVVAVPAERNHGDRPRRGHLLKRCLALHWFRVRAQSCRLEPGGGSLKTCSRPFRDWRRPASRNRGTPAPCGSRKSGDSNLDDISERDGSPARRKIHVDIDKEASPRLETGDGEAPVIRREFHILRSARRCDGAPDVVGCREGELRDQVGVQTST